MRYSLFALLTVAAFSLPLAGCGPQKPAKKPDAHGHDHDHDHAHHEGPHGGHLLELGNEEYHAEWTHDDAGKIDIYILDKDMKKDVAIAAEKLTIKTKVGDAAKDYDLEAANAAEGKASQFTTTDKELLNILTTVGKGVEAALDVSIEGKDYSQKFEEHSDHDHGHKH